MLKPNGHAVQFGGGHGAGDCGFRCHHSPARRAIASARSALAFSTKPPGGEIASPEARKSVERIAATRGFRVRQFRSPSGGGICRSDIIPSAGWHSATSEALYLHGELSPRIALPSGKLAHVGPGDTKPLCKSRLRGASSFEVFGKCVHVILFAQSKLLYKGLVCVQQLDFIGHAWQNTLIR